MENKSQSTTLLYTLARDANDATRSATYYQALKTCAPNDWEPAFFTLYYSCSREKSQGSCDKLSNGLENVFLLIYSLDDTAEATDALILVAAYSTAFALSVKDENEKHFASLDQKSRKTQRGNYFALGSAAAEIVCTLLDLLELYFPDRDSIQLLYRPIYLDLCLFSDFIGSDKRAYYRERAK